MIAEPGRMVRQKAGLNRSILNQGWHIFETLLSYKLEERGGHLCKVPAHYTSQTAVLHQSPDKRGVPLPVKMVSQLTQTWHSQVRSFC